MADPASGQTPRRATLRLGAREQARLQLVVIVMIVALLAIALRPLLLNLIQVRDFQVCQTNVRKIAQALAIYSQEWDDTFPAASSWLDSVQGRLTPTTGTGFSAEHYLKCPRDKSNSPCSYVYNSLMEGLSPTVRETDPEKAERRRRLRRLDRAVLIVEKHGAKANAHAPLQDWDAVREFMDLPHEVPEPTGSLILGSGRAWYQNRESLQNLSGKRF